MLKRTVIAHAGTMLIAFLAALPAAASEGRVPIYQLPITISEPGSYFLSRDITHFGAGQSITIEASDVTIDFNGHTLTKDNAGNFAIASDGDYTNIVIRNGRLIGGNIGIRLRNLVGDDFAVRIEEMIVAESLNEGIYVYGHSLIGSSSAVIRDNVVHDTGNDGISLRFIWGGQVSGNVVQGAGTGTSDHGIYMHSCRGVSVRHNTISHSGGDGVRAWYSWYCSFDWNHMTYNDGWGLDIYQGDSHVYSDNRAYGNGSGGFDIPLGEGHVNAGGNYPP